MRNWFVWLLCAFTITSCSKQERDLEKFIARLNAREINEASTYIYEGDHARFRFFCNMLEKNSNLFFELHSKRDILVDGKEAIAVEIECVNISPFFRNYMEPLNLLQPDGTMRDTIYIRRTSKGKKLSFDWAGIGGENLKIASISNPNVNTMNIRESNSTNSRIVGKLPQGSSILIDEYTEDPKWVRCYGLDYQCRKQEGFIYKPSLSTISCDFFHLGIFESMSILLAAIIFFILGVIIVYGGAIIDAVFSGGGCGGWILTTIMIIGILILMYMLLEKILFELFLINLPY